MNSGWISYEKTLSYEEFVLPNLMYNHETQLPSKASHSIDLQDALLCLSCASLIKQCSTLPLEYKSIQYMEAVR